MGFDMNVEFLRMAFWQIVMVAGPVLLVALGIGLFIGILQPATSINEQTLSFVPKLFVVLITFGLLANLMMAAAWAVVARLAVVYHHAVEGDSGVGALFVMSAGVAGVVINTVLMVLNLLPIPPLDGGRVLAGIAPAPVARWLERLEPFGFPIVLVLLVTGALAWLMVPATNVVIFALLDLVQISPRDFATVHSMIRPRWGA